MHETSALSTAESSPAVAAATNGTPPVPAPASDGTHVPAVNSGERTSAASEAATVSPSPPAGDPAPLWLRRGDQAVVAGLVAVILLFTTWHLAEVGWWRGDAVEIDRLPSSAYQYRIDVNRATWVEWAQLDGIGETLARRIIEDRETRGPFQSVDDVQRVNGIGPKKLEQIRAHLSLDSGNGP